MPLPAPMTGRFASGHEEPVSPAEENRVRPSTVACSSVASATGSRLSPSPTYEPTSGGTALHSALAGSVSHSPNDAFASGGPVGSLTQVDSAVSTSASARDDAK